MIAKANDAKPLLERVLVEETYPEGRVAATVSMRRDPRSGELSFTPSALRKLDRLRSLLVKMHQASSPGHLRTLRDALGLTQQQFADRLGVSSQTVSRWERGEARPSEPTLARIRALQQRERRAGVAVPASSR